MVRYSLNYVTWKYRKDVASDLKSIYGAGTIERAAQALDDFEERWGKSYPSIGQSWRKLAAYYSVLRLLARDQKGDLHNQRN